MPQAEQLRFIFILVVWLNPADTYYNSNTIQKPGFSASNKHCQANIRSNFGKFNSSHTKNLVSFTYNSW
jgi:hypothetical protein